VKTYKYKEFKFIIEDGELNMTYPEYYEGQEIDSNNPTRKEVWAVISDYYDLNNRTEPLSVEEINFINNNLSYEEKEEIFGTKALFVNPSISRPGSMNEVELEKEERNLSQSAMRSAKYRNPKGSANYFAPYRIRKHLNEIEVPGVEFDLTNIKSGINGNIWEKGGHLKPEVREKLLKIAELFYESLHIDFPIIDIYFTGSLANYNWTSQSDIDVHLILDIPNEEDKDFLAEYIDAKKESWKNKHDIKIYGFPVELFAKDSEDFHKNKAVYSLQNDKWVVRPSKKNIKIDTESVKEKAADMMSDIDNALEINDSKERLDSVDKIKDRIKKMRKAGLEKGGEYSVENLVFKTIRNNGYLDKLSSEKTSIIDKDLSLKEGSDEKKMNTLKVMKGIPDMTDEKVDIIKQFINFTCSKLGMENPETLYCKIDKFWIDALMNPPIKTNEGSISFVEKHNEFLQQKIQDVFGGLNSIHEIREASILMMTMALYLAIAIGANVKELSELWIDIAKANGALE
jgi:predicted nucleotidyltransferase